MWLRSFRHWIRSLVFGSAVVRSDDRSRDSAGFRADVEPVVDCSLLGPRPQGVDSGEDGGCFAGMQAGWGVVTSVVVPSCIPIPPAARKTDGTRYENLGAGDPSDHWPRRVTASRTGGRVRGSAASQPSAGLQRNRIPNDIVRVRRRPGVSPGRTVAIESRDEGGASAGRPVTRAAAGLATEASRERER